MTCFFFSRSQTFNGKGVYSVKKAGLLPKCFETLRIYQVWNNPILVKVSSKVFIKIFTLTDEETSVCISVSFWEKYSKRNSIFSEYGRKVYN